MATPTAVAAARPAHRTARLADNAFTGALALDWANAQALALGSASVQSATFDPVNDRIVMVSVGGASTVLGAWIAVGANPTAAAAAGSMWIAQGAAPVPVYVPAGMLVAGLQGATAGTLALVPALLES
jgi:hypothetical protein